MDKRNVARPRSPALTDWLGPRGRLTKMRVRHVAPMFEGDMIRFSVRVTELSTRPDGSLIACEVEGRNQQQDTTLTGSCVLSLPHSGA